MAHAMDEIGYPLDPELRRLEDRLGELAARWREAYARPGDREHEIHHEYVATIERLYELGWDDVLDIDSVLRDALMPAEYLRRHQIIFKTWTTSRARARPAPRDGQTATEDPQR